MANPAAAGPRSSALRSLLLALLVCSAFLGAVESRIHPTREHAATRSVTELRSFDMWALDSAQVRALTRGSFSLTQFVCGACSKARENGAAQVRYKPYPHAIVEKFVPKGRLSKINQDFPKGLREHVLEEKASIIRRLLSQCALPERYAPKETSSWKPGISSAFRAQM